MGPNPNGPLSKLRKELLNTQVFSGSVQWVRPLEISWKPPSCWVFRGVLKVQSWPSISTNTPGVVSEMWTNLKKSWLANGQPTYPYPPHTNKPVIIKGALINHWFPLLTQLLNPYFLGGGFVKGFWLTGHKTSNRFGNSEMTRTWKPSGSGSMLNFGGCTVR